MDKIVANHTTNDLTNDSIINDAMNTRIDITNDKNMDNRESLAQELLSLLKKCKKEEKKIYINQIFDLFQATNVDEDILSLVNSHNQKENSVSKNQKKDSSEPFFYVENDETNEIFSESTKDEECVFGISDDEDEEELNDEKLGEEEAIAVFSGLVDLSAFSLIDLVELNKHCQSYAPMYFLRKKLYNTCYGKGEYTDVNRDIPLSFDISDEIFLSALQTGSPLGVKVLDHKYNENFYSSPDEWLVLLIQSGNKEAEDILTNRLATFINKIVNSIKGRGKINSRYRDADDFAQDAFMGLLNSFSDYKIERKTKFQDFARHVINKHIRTQLNKEFNKRSKASSNSLSYYKQVSDDPSDTTFLDLLSSDSLTPEQRLIVEESIIEALPILTELERYVLIFKYHGFSYKEIAQVMETNVKGVDNGIQRIHKKGEKYRKEEYILQGDVSLTKDSLSDKESSITEKEVENIMISGLKKIGTRSLKTEL